MSTTEVFPLTLNVTSHIADSIPSATLTNTTVQDNSPDITYSGSWTEQSGPNFSGGTSHYTQGPGNAFQYSFTGEHSFFFLALSPVVWCLISSLANDPNTE